MPSSEPDVISFFPLSVGSSPLGCMTTEGRDVNLHHIWKWIECVTMICFRASASKNDTVFHIFFG